jgi:hypothetical protein
MIHDHASRSLAFKSAMKRHLLRSADGSKAKHGRHKKKAQTGGRRISRETRQLDLSM